LETEEGDGQEDSDAWLDDTIDLSSKDESYQNCSSRVFVGSRDARLDVPELLDLLSEKAVDIGAQNESQTPSSSSIMADGDPIAWKFTFSCAS
jgi:hypothetical protein